MSKEFCLDCGVLLSPDTRICPVCGFETSDNAHLDIAFGPGLYHHEPETKPGR